MDQPGKIRVKMIKAPYRYQWPGRSRVSMVRFLGPCLLDEPIARSAIDEGYAEPFDPRPTVQKSPARRRRASTKIVDEPIIFADAADESQSDRMDQQSDADDDRPEGGDQAIPDAG